MTQMTQLEIVGMQAVPFTITVRPHLSRSDRHRFFRSMRQAVSCQRALLSPEATHVAQELIDRMVYGAIRQFARPAKDESR